MKGPARSSSRRGLAAALSLVLLVGACRSDAGDSVRQDRQRLDSSSAAALLAGSEPRVHPAAHTPAPAFAAVDSIHALVHHSPTCGCCGKWVDHARANGLTAEVRLTQDIQAVKRAYTIPASVQSCHTTIVGGYIVEGHVPADVIAQLLRERPMVRGIAAPGMPLGSPGMEGPYSQPYEIVTFDERGPTGVFARR